VRGGSWNPLKSDLEKGGGEEGRQGEERGGGSDGGSVGE